MKRALLVVLILVLAAFAATAAQAQTMSPLWDVRYNCTYTYPPANELNPGWSIFTGKTVFLGGQLLRGTEIYGATTQTGKDTRKIAFAKPVDVCVRDAYGNCLYVTRTDWEFTINPDGPQCKTTSVREWGHRINFNGCTDGHSRVCTTY